METFKCIVPVGVYMSAQQKKEAKKWINKILTGHENCNRVDEDGKIVIKKKSIPHVEKLTEVHSRIEGSHCVQLEVTMDEDGKFSFKVEE